MASEDISRDVLQPLKRYSGVRMQQGRVLLDSDWNENESINNEDLRRTLAEIICSKGTPNNGFAIGDVEFVDEQVAGADPLPSIDFSIADGSFYLGGLRLQHTAYLGRNTLQNQSDWLQIDADAQNLPLRPEQLDVDETRTDLVYVQAWEQCVTAVEDSELRERALGGPDTSVRVRRMQRIAVATDVADQCADAFNDLVGRLSAAQEPDGGDDHGFDSRSCELRSKARLTIAPDAEGITEDPCRPAVPGGYLGADNQTIRVQLTATNRFIWGYDNAAPLYRVQVRDIPDDATGARRQVRFLNLPRDQAAQPLAGQAVEIIPWGSLLPNAEKVAEFQGALFTVATSFNPADNTLTLAEPVAQEWLDWLASHANLWSDRDPVSEQQYLYLRLWTGGSQIAAEPDHEFVPGTPVPLAGAGLSVTFSDFGLRGDYWVAAARPHTPDIVVPWELLDQAPPTGPRYFFAPLALIHWRVDANGELAADLHDCRQRFAPLCDARGCCTVTVGAGGQFNSIEQALDWLPEDGGKICLLPGTHRTRAVIARRRNITISGCDKQTRVIHRADDLRAPVFQIVDSQCITIEHMEIVALGGTAVLAGATALGTLSELSIAHNRIVAAQYGVRVARGQDVVIEHNHIRMLDKPNALEAILVLAEDCRIERNDIGVIPAERLPPPEVPGDDPNPDPNDPCADLELLYLHPRILTLYLDQLFFVLVTLFPTNPFIALGGIRVAGASERVKIFANRIVGGASNGVTLGGSGLDNPRDDDEPAPPVINVTGNRFRGVVAQDGVGVAGTTLTLNSIDRDETHVTTTGSDGYAEAQVASGRYSIVAVSPGQRVNAQATTAGNLNRFTLDRFTDRDPDESIGFLYEIHIDDNEIAHMGLSGIGVPAPVARDPDSVNQLATRRNVLSRVAALLGYPVISLDIHHNHIHRCMRNVFDRALLDLSRTRGLGGISLGFCENVAIAANRIEHIGATPINPTCGIFVAFGERLTINDNRIFDDRRPDPNQDTVAGTRGGIVVVATAIGVDEILRFNADRNLNNGQHAGRIYDNNVYQIIGHALRVAAIGPLSIHDNRLNTELSGVEFLERLAGAALILNLGGIGRLPAGDTLFNDNQCRLARGNCISAQVIWTLDDLGYGDNQSSALAEGLVLTDNLTLFVNTFLIGRTLRTTGSRFKEVSSVGREGDFRISLVSRSVLMNNTSNNQGDHCIFPFDTLVVDEGNQELDDRFCEERQISVAQPVTGFQAAAAFNERAQFRG